MRLWTEHPGELAAPIPDAGTYRATIVDARELDEPRHALRVMLRLAGTNFAPILDTLPTHGPAAPRIVRFLLALGFAEPPSELDPAQLIGREIAVTLKLDDWNGRPGVAVTFAGYAPAAPAPPRKSPRKRR